MEFSSLRCFIHVLTHILRPTCAGLPDATHPQYSLGSANGEDNNYDENEKRGREGRKGQEKGGGGATAVEQRKNTWGSAAAFSQASFAGAE
eukprot:3263759-Pyramimonas_sp.AAC.1